MEVIVIEKQAFNKLLEEMRRTIIDALKEGRKEVKVNVPQQDEWITSSEAQKILNCKRVRLRKLRENWDIKSTPKGKHFLYLKSSLYEYLDKTH